jgi:hypothetical protein
MCCVQRELTLDSAGQAHSGLRSRCTLPQHSHRWKAHRAEFPTRHDGITRDLHCTSSMPRGGVGISAGAKCGRRSNGSLQGVASALRLIIEGGEQNVREKLGIAQGRD